jgi:hypothetical protein
MVPSNSAIRGMLIQCKVTGAMQLHRACHDYITIPVAPYVARERRAFRGFSM